MFFSGWSGTGRVPLVGAVYWLMTDNWLELILRSIAEDHRVRDLEDPMTCDILAGIDAEGVGIASATFAIVGLPSLRLEREPTAARSRRPSSPALEGARRDAPAECLRPSAGWVTCRGNTFGSWRRL